MALYDELFDHLQSHHPRMRLKLAYGREEQLPFLTVFELDRIALLLLAASSSKMREEYPVIGESRITKKTFPFGAFG